MTIAVRMMGECSGTGHFAEERSPYNSIMQTIPDVAIIGGGVIGLTTAYYLARDGVRVDLFDRSAPGTEASWAGAGIIPPGNSANAVSAYDRLRASSAEAFPILTRELFEQTGIDNGYHVCGGIELFDSHAESVEIERLVSEEGIDFRRIRPSRAQRIVVGIMPGERSMLWLPEMAQVRNPWHMRALIAACVKRGVTIHSNEPVTGFRISGNRIEAARMESGERSAGRFLFAAGAWSDGLLTQLGVRTGIHPVRGQMVLFNVNDPKFDGIVCVGKRYLVGRGDGRVLAGSTEEPEAGFEKETTETGIEELIHFARELLLTLVDQPIEKTWAGLRPGSHDGLPMMGRLPGFENAFVAAGHFRSGIQLSPATALLMSEVLTDRPPSIPLDDFRVGRPPTQMRSQAFRS